MGRQGRVQAPKQQREQVPRPRRQEGGRVSGFRKSKFLPHNQ